MNNNSISGNHGTFDNYAQMKRPMTHQSAGINTYDNRESRFQAADGSTTADNKYLQSRGTNAAFASRARSGSNS